MLLWKLWKWWRARRKAVAAPTETRPTGKPFPKLVVASLKMLLRDRRTFLWSLAVPILFAVIFGLQKFDGPKHVKVTVVPTARSAFADGIVSGLRRDDVFRVAKGRDLAATQKRLRDGKTDLVLASPAQRSTPIRVFFEPSNTNNEFALGSLQRFVDAMNLRLAGVTNPSVRIAERPVEVKDTRYYDYLLPGLVALGVMNLSIIGMAVAMTRFREQQILKRILATPLAPAKFLAAQLSARLALSIFQAAVIVFVAVNFFDAKVHGDPVWIFLFVALGNLVFLNIGSAIAGRAKNVDTAQAMAQLVSLPMIFLSGVFFPTDNAPPVLSEIVGVLPLTPLSHGLRKIMLDGDSITKTAPDLGLLVAWVVVSFLVARRSFRFGETRPGRGLRLRHVERALEVPAP